MLREEQPHTSIYAGVYTAGRHLGREGHGGPDGHQAPAVCPHGKQGHEPSGLHLKDCYQQVQG